MLVDGNFIIVVPVLSTDAGESVLALIAMTVFGPVPIALVVFVTEARVTELVNGSVGDISVLEIWVKCSIGTNSAVVDNGTSTDIAVFVDFVSESVTRIVGRNAVGYVLPAFASDVDAFVLGLVSINVYFSVGVDHIIFGRLLDVTNLVIESTDKISVSEKLVNLSVMVNLVVADKGDDVVDSFAMSVTRLVNCNSVGVVSAVSAAVVFAFGPSLVFVTVFESVVVVLVRAAIELRVLSLIVGSVCCSGRHSTALGVVSITGIVVNCFVVVNSSVEDI